MKQKWGMLKKAQKKPPFTSDELFNYTKDGTIWQILDLKAFERLAFYTIDVYHCWGDE